MLPLRLLALVVAALAAGLVASGSAAAKTIWPSGWVCGQTRCFSVHGRASAALFGWEAPGPWAELVLPSPAPYYTIRFRIDQFRGVEILEQVLYVPGRHMVRIYDSRNLVRPAVGRPLLAVSLEGRRDSDEQSRLEDLAAPHAASLAAPELRVTGPARERKRRR